MSERDLWQGVLLQAITDARLDPSAWPVPASAYDETAEARTYLTTPSDDLAEVCSFAGIDMQALLVRMQGRLANVPPVKATGKRKRNPNTYKYPPVITYAGEILTIRQWSERTGVNQATIRVRLKKGWPMEKVLRPCRKLSVKQALAA